MDPHLDAFLNTCRDIYERRVREGTWPWPDSTLSEDMVESESTNHEPV